ncbi:MAG: HD domain-containing phosphohydrolase [Desulfovibrionaceae bacterium]
MFQEESSCASQDSLSVVTTALHEFAESLGAAVDARDHHTRLHSEEVAEMSRCLALRLGLSSGDAEVIHVAAHLHDVGKIGIPDAVLHKSGPLDEAEWQMLRRHPAIGAAIVRPVRALRQCGIMGMILHHHERFDGRGYPHGLSGRSIPRGARIIAVADSVSAMLQKRPYRSALSFAEARAEIMRCSGTQFDPEVAEAFEKSAPLFQALLQELVA